MLGRVEQAEAEKVTKNASNGRMIMVSQPKSQPKEAVQNGRLRKEIREILKTLCGYKKVEILEGAVCADHVHLCLSIPPKIRISDFMGYLKGKSALMIFDKHPQLGSKNDRHLWARGYYVTTVGERSQEVVQRYILEQQEEDQKEDSALR